MSRIKYFLLLLVTYFLPLFYFAVLNRSVETNSHIRLDPFWDYCHLSCNNIKDILINIVAFVPVGVIIGLTNTKSRIIVTLLIGLLASLAIECSQLLWKRGVFDVDDLINNTMGAVIGCLIVVMWQKKGKMV